MRYRDCPTVETAVKIAATVDDAWALLTDIALPVRFSPELQRVEWVDPPGEVAVGRRFRGVNRNEHLGEWTTECVITEVEDQRRWTWNVVIDAEVGASWGFELDPAGDGVIVRQWARIGPGPSGLSAAIATMPEKEGRIIARRLREFEQAMTATLDGVRQLLETAA